MDTENTANDLGIPIRLRRAKGRAVRTQSIASRFTPEEERELSEAASAAGRYTAEWAREVLLREARRKPSDAAVITEVIALRMLMSTVLRSVALGERLTGDAYAQILSEVRNGKHAATRDVLNQYEKPTKEQ
jgi:hypothetical protein